MRNIIKILDCDVYLCIWMMKKKKITTWLKLGENFIDQDNIRAIYRLGNDTKIERIWGGNIVVNVLYDKVIKMLPAAIRKA